MNDIQIQKNIDLSELIERVKTLGFASREIDAEIHCALFGYEPQKDEFGIRYWRNGRWIGMGSIPHYTGQFNAAMELVPSNMIIWNMRGRGSHWSVALADGEIVSETVEDIASPEIAICAISLIVLADIANENNKELAEPFTNKNTPENAQTDQTAVEKVLKELLNWSEQQICMHEETHRGGFIWEICDMCGSKWADDEGGKPEFKWPEPILSAQNFFEQSARKNEALSAE